MLRIVYLLIATAGLLAAGLAWTTRSPAVVFLVDENGAQWIQHDEPILLHVRAIRERVVGFRKTVEVGTRPERAILSVRALRSVKVLLDGKLVFSSPADPAAWTRRHQIDLAPRLTPGRHAIVLLASNDTGPPCLLAYSEALGVRTGPDWETSADGIRWAAAWPASRVRSSALSREFPRVDQAFFASLPVSGGVFLIVFLTVALRRQGGIALTPRVLRGSLLAAWAVLGIHNLVELPLYLGFDIKGHHAYIRFLAEQQRLPLPNEGWSMFQAPLYHVLSAPLYAGFRHLFQEETAQRLLRLLPLACGLAAIETCYRILRRLWPEDPGRQRAGILFAALCPMGLYLSPIVGNEMLAGLLLAAALTLAMRLVHDPVVVTQRRVPLALGGLLGLSLLTKLSGIALTAPILTAVAWARWRTSEGSPRRRAARAAQSVAEAAGSLLLVMGWYYARNWIVLGRPFYGGTESELGLVWWQDPGYRTWRQLLGFGESLGHPVYASVTSFLDGLYSTFSLDAYLGSMMAPGGMPPWNLDFMLAGAWWGLVPIALMGVGSLSVIRPENAGIQRVLWFSGVCLAAMLAALLYRFLSVPYYSVVKASYTVGLLPCYAVLLAAGFGVLTRGRIARAVVYGLLSGWGLCAYLAYWAV